MNPADMEEWNHVRSWEWRQLWDQVSRQVRVHVRSQMHRQVMVQVWGPVANQFREGMTHEQG